MAGRGRAKRPLHMLQRFQVRYWLAEGFLQHGARLRAGDVELGEVGGAVGEFDLLRDEEPVQVLNQSRRLAGCDV